MTNLKSKHARDRLMTYALVISAFLIFQTLSSAGVLSRSLTGQLVPVCVYIVAAIALNLVVGISGELSLGHAGFLSIGAFSGAVFAHVFSFIPSSELRLVISMLGGGLMAGVMGFLIGIPVLRLRGDYLAIVTLAFGEIIKNVMNIVYLGFDEFGWKLSLNQSLSLSSGVSILNGPMGVTGNQKLSTFAIGFLIVMFSLVVVQNLIRSRHGRAIMAIRDNRIAAESIGLSVTRYKMTAFVLSAILTGMAGTLYMMNYASVAPSKFNFNTSILILVFVVLGGMGNIRGSIIMAALLTVLPEQLRGLGDFRMLIYSVLLITMMLLRHADKGKYVLAKLQDLVNSLRKKQSNVGGSI